MAIRLDNIALHGHKDGVNDAHHKTIEKALVAGDEAEAVRQLSELDPSACDAAALQALISQARSIDRNDIALQLSQSLPAGKQRDLLTLHLRHEMGEAVADEFAGLLETGDAQDAALLPLVGALEAESRVDEAITLLEQGVAHSPDWLAGHQTLAQLRWTHDVADATASMQEAAASRADDELLHAALLGTLKSLEDHEKLSALIPQFLERFPASALMRMVSAESYSEMGRLQDADRLFADLAAVEDPAFDAARMRHLMRTERPELAMRVGARAVTTHALPECWAWMGAALRAAGDPRADWYYRGSDLISTQQIDFDEQQRTELAELLRSLHNAAGPPYGQSPRGGTQTLGHLLKRREPIIVALRGALLASVKKHIAALPEEEAQHPILGHSRKGPMFEGAWSILLRGGGHHVSHIHSHGWISSAIYIDLPEAMTQAEDQKGWLQIGVPPITAGRSIDPITVVQPAPLRLALFPSLFWHGTLPFDDGERLTVAFDIIAR